MPNTKITSRNVEAAMLKTKFGAGEGCMTSRSNQYQAKYNPASASPTANAGRFPAQSKYASHNPARTHASPVPII